MRNDPGVARRWRLAGLAALTIVVGVWAEQVLWRAGDTWTYIAYDLLVGIAGVLVSVIVWDQRRNIVGPLLFAYAAWFLISPVRLRADSWFISSSWIMESLLVPIFGYMVLAYPSGRLGHWTSKAIVQVAFVEAVIFSIAQLFVAPSSGLFDSCVGGPCPSRPPLVGSAHPGLFHALQNTQKVVVALLGAAFLAALITRVFSSTRRRRRQLVAVTVAATASAVARIAFDAGGSGSGSHTQDVIAHLVHLGLMLSFLGGIWSTRAERAGVADLLARLAAAPQDRLEPLLADLLMDPDLRLELFAPGRTPEPPEAAPGRAISVLRGAVGPLAYLVHDATVCEDERLLASVVAAAGLALDNEALREELRRQLAEVRASRQRLVEAADGARQRLERNLHDGAQQRLLSVGLAVKLAAHSLGDNDAASAMLAQAGLEVDAAVVELRELARGLHPAVLTDHGLSRAVALLADRSPVPVTLDAALPDGLPEQVQIAAYYVVSEALQNARKHAAASSISVHLEVHDRALRAVIRDDGRGGAVVNGGSGLRGLLDRVEALGGSLVVSSAPDAGTTLVAELPCG